MSRHAIRWRITALAAIIAALVLALAGVLVVVLVQRQLIDNLDRSLEQRADQVEALALDDPSAALANFDVEDRFAQVISEDGTVLFATRNVSGVAALAPLPSGRQANMSRDDLPLEDDAYRVLIRRFAVGSGDRFVVVGENIDDLRDTVRALAITLAIVFPLSVAALAVVVWGLVGRTLRPVEAIRAEVAGIGLDQLDRRVAVPSSEDEIARLASTMNDMLERLEGSSARQREFVGDVSHELRTPLTRMRTALEVDLATPDTDFEETARTALGDVNEMQGLVDDLLFLARHDAGTSVVQPVPVDLDVVVDTEVRFARQLRSDVTIDMSAVTSAVAIGSAAQLTRLVRNLLSNAVRHANHAVRVSLVEDAGAVTLVVADDGPGIPAADRERVFERFVRLDDARVARDGGSGLGLAIAREITTSHDGTITIGESHLGGAEVTVSLRAAV